MSEIRNSDCSLLRNTQLPIQSFTIFHTKMLAFCGSSITERGPK